MASQANIWDVAKAAGVSISTVSRALRGSELVKPVTRQKVLRAAKKLDYEPNTMARSLRTHASGLVGLIVPHLRSATFTELAENIQRLLRRAGYQVVLITSESDRTYEKDSLSILRAHQVDGVILLGSMLHAPPAPQGDLPTVYLTRGPEGSDSTSVLAADFEGIREAVAYLLGLGHRRVALISGPSEETRRGYISAHEESGVKVDDELYFSRSYAPSTGVEGVEALFALAEPPTALVLQTQTIWQTALPRITELGLRVPEDLSIICRESSPLLLGWWRPPMTTIDLNVEGLGNLAVDLLLKKIRGNGNGEGAPAQYLVKSQLVVRGSCAPPTGGGSRQRAERGHGHS